MKKAKFFLPAIGLLSVIAGALAFKAQHRFTGRLACYTTASGVVNHKFLGKFYTAKNLGTPLYCTIPAEGNEYITQSVTFLQ